MLKIISRCVKTVLALSIMFALSSFVAPTEAGGDGPVVLVDYEVVGTTVQVTVQNTGKKPKTVEVHVYATVDGKQMKSYTPVAVSSRGTSSTVVGFIQTIESVETVGIIEDSGPV
jgi:hypothetical protein